MDRTGRTVRQGLRFVADSQNAHHPDKTQPLDAMPAAPKPPAQMDMLKAASAEQKLHEKTQPLHIIPPASLAPPMPEEIKAPAVAPSVPPATESVPLQTSAPSVAPPAPHVDAATAPAAPAGPATQPSAKPAPSSGAVPAAPPLRVEPPKTSAASIAAPPRPPATPAHPASSSASHGEAAKPQAAPVQTSASAAAHSEAPKDYVKTVAMMAASPPPAAASTQAPAAAPDIDQLRITTPSSPVGDRFRWLGHKIATTAFVTDILPGAAKKLNAYAALTRLNKPIGIWLLLWPVLWALWLSSGGKPDPHVFIVFVLGTILTRSAGCAINDYADRNFDGHVKRTKDRPLVTGAVDPIEALALCAGLGLIALGLTLTLNQLAQQLTLVGGVLVITYPFFKRFFPLPQAYLGIAFTWSVPMAYAAQTGTVPRAAIVMFLAGLAWTVAYDTMYAMVDREDDKKLGIRSSAILFGDADRFIIGIMQLMTVLGLWLIGHEMELGLWYGLGLAVASTFALYQQLLIRKRKPEDCFKAFLNNNYFGMSVFIGILLDYTFR